MEALTIEHVLLHKFTAIDCVKYFKPDWSNEQCDYYIWENTCFPFSIEIMIDQLNEDFLNLNK